MKTQLVFKYRDVISMDNLLAAWQEFIRGKRKKRDVQEFSRNLIDNILQLHEDLAKKTYRHGGYHKFNISDPKPRNISKATVRDRLVHHAVYRILYPFFDKTFIYDSYSCRIGKGTHKAIRRFRSMFREVSNYNRKACFVLKLDIKQFFDRIDHNVLKEILTTYIPDQDILWLLGNIIDSFVTSISTPHLMRGRDPSEERFLTSFGMGSRGLPLGNLTSQLFVNVYMNEFDQFVKHKLKVKYYIRYADDFVILSVNKDELMNQLIAIREFLSSELKLILHPDKIVLKTFSSGIDFLGWVNFPQHRVLRTSTRRRMHRHIRTNMTIQSLQSYLGLLKHGNTAKIRQGLLNNYWLFLEENRVR